MGFIQGVLQPVISAASRTSDSPSTSTVPMLIIVSSQILNQLVGIFLGLGLTRIGLNLVSGKPVEMSMLFG